MQKHVPFFMLFASLFTPQLGFAVANDWGAPQNIISSARQTTRCAAGSTTDTRCTAFNSQIGGPPTQASPEACDANTPAAATKAGEECKKGEAYEMAQLCCDGRKAEECIRRLNQADTNAALEGVKRKIASANTEARETNGVQRACATLSSTSGDVRTLSNGIAGACHAAKARWMAKCQGEQIYKLPLGPCNGINYRERVTASLKPEADRLNPQTAERDANNFAQTQTGGLNCGNMASAQPPGSVGPGSSTPGGNTPGGGNNTPGSTNQATRDAKTQSTGSGLGNLTSMLPLAMMAMQMMNQQQQQQPTQQTAPVNPSLDKVDCTVNPNLAGCPAAAAAGSDSWNPKTASIEAGANDPAGGNFNPADENSMTPASTDTPAEPKQPSAVTVGTVPNGGGGMPGGGGGGTASLGGGGGGGGAGLGGKTVTDVLHGMSAGGGGMAAMNSNMNMKNGEGGGGYTYGQGGYGHDDAGLDLSQFLPGGKQDPARKIAGIAQGGPNNFQIQSKDVNIFSRISERIKARCSQGLLRDCIP